jgi:hypothetical protein
MTAKIHLLTFACLALTLFAAPPPQKAPPRYTVSGRIAGLETAHHARIVLSAANKPNRSATTLADGTYIIRNVPPGSYSVRPAHALYRFSPTFHTAAVTSHDVINIDFTASRLPPKK